MNTMALAAALFQLKLILLKIVMPCFDLSCVETYCCHSQSGLLNCLTAQLLHYRLHNCEKNLLIRVFCCFFFKSLIRLSIKDYIIY